MAVVSACRSLHDPVDGIADDAVVTSLATKSLATKLMMSPISFYVLFLAGNAACDGQ
jgi:hypothetical protein